MLAIGLAASASTGAADEASVRVQEPASGRSSCIVGCPRVHVPQHTKSAMRPLESRDQAQVIGVKAHSSTGAVLPPFAPSQTVIWEGCVLRDMRAGLNALRHRNEPLRRTGSSGRTVANDPQHLNVLNIEVVQPDS